MKYYFSRELQNKGTMTAYYLPKKNVLCLHV